MGARRGKLLLLLAVGAVAGIGGTSSAATASDVCDADDPRQECSANDDVGDDGCADDHENCRAWSERGECERNPGYMLSSCRRSCDVCEHELDANDFGVPQLVPAHHAGPVREVLSKSATYMQGVVGVDPIYDPVRDECRNMERNCAQWALGSGCDDNPTYMKMQCSPACRSCDYVLEMKRRCALDPDGKDAIEAGGMDGLFERMIRVADYSNWQPTVLSRPIKRVETNADGTFSSTPSCEDDVANPCGARIGPWVITLENFLSDMEISTLLNWGADLGYERSKAGDMVIESRTSAHAWCKDECYDDPTVRLIRLRIAHVTGIPDENYECFQLLRYVPGTYYRPHNDMIDAHATQSHGPRLLTFFMYFNEVEEGGGTRFPKLDGLTVEPRRGRVLIWPSVRDEDLFKEELRTEHEAMPVTRGEKYAANAWIHMRDFQTPFEIGCPS